MAWISLVESAESVLRLENGLDQSHIAKSILIVKKYCCVEWHTGIYKPLQFGMTCEHSIKNQGHFLLAQSISFTQGFHARISVLQEMEKAWAESEVSYSMRLLDCPNPLILHSFFSKTCPLSLEEVELKLSGRLPKWGTIVDGVLYQHNIPIHHSCEKDGSYWPTPTASQAAKPIRKPSPTRLKKKHGYDLQDKIGEKYPELIGQKINVQFLEWLMGYPLNWTEVEHWEIQSFPNKQKQPSKP